MPERHHQPPFKPRRDTKPPASARPKPNPTPRQPPAEDNGSSPPPHASASSSEGNVDRVLFEDIAEMVPLIETLMGQRSNSSFRRRASMIYTPAPAKKVVGSKDLKGSSSKKRREDDPQKHRDKQNGEADEFSSVSSRSLAMECLQKEREENDTLKLQLDELQKKLMEKDEKVKMIENSQNELKHEIMAKDALVKSVHSQLNNTKIKLADKQAALEKLEWEAREANINNSKFQSKLDSIDFEISAFMQLFMKLSKAEPARPLQDDTIYFQNLDQLPNLDMDESAMEEARMAYVEALAIAKENPCEETLTLASEARLRLQAFVF